MIWWASHTRLVNLRSHDYSVSTDGAGRGRGAQVDRTECGQG